MNNIKDKTYTQLISGGPVCGAGFWCRISAWHGEYLLMLRNAYVAVNGCSSFSCPLGWCCSGGAAQNPHRNSTIQEDKKKKNIY
jgi:hypothetical protein